MEAPSISTEEQLLRFLEEYARDRLEMELLTFWGRHPNARFSRGAISCALDCKKLSVDRALKDMVGLGLVDTDNCNGVPFYSLTANEEKRRPVMELASLGWDQLHLMVRRLEQNRDSGQPL